MDIRSTKAYELIEMFYNTQCAKRSGVPLMNHIHEGLEILDALCADQVTKEAFCLHPLVQNSPDSNELDFDSSQISTEVMELSFEYKEKANSYLCRPDTDWVTSSNDVALLVGELSERCRLMLIADKIQNQKDFYIYHSSTHARAWQLFEYFLNWLNFLR